ncbi:MAG: hypothetical protein KAR11_02670 [Phycisphaerae bacterium]|nr:hypothetical protein [Phycisphaerae bacterium]
MGIIETIGDKLGLRGGGDKMQYLLVGALALVIVIAIVVIITSLTGSGNTGGRKDTHCWDVETNQEVVITPDDWKNNKFQSQDGPGMMMGGPGMMGGGLMLNPKTGKRTLLSMITCPSCKKRYLPARYEGLALDDFDEETGAQLDENGEPIMMGPMGGDMQDNICKHCGIDTIQWYRDNRKKKKK